MPENMREIFLDVVKMKLVGVRNEVEGVTAAQLGENRPDSPVFPKDVVPKFREGGERDVCLEGFFRVPEKFPGRDFAARVSLFDLRGKEMAPDFFEGNVRAFRKSTCGTNRVKMNQNISQIKNDRFNH